jgi:long-chain fatty acid transport protein
MQKLMKTLPLIGILLAVSESQAAASAFMVRENSSESIATAYAGNASRSDDAATVFNNPAGMSWLAPGTQLEGGAAIVLPDMHFQGNATIGAAALPGTNDRDIGQVALIPHFYGVYDLNDRTTLGLALTVPFGSTVDYGTAWPGRYVNVKTAAISLDFNPNIAYKLTDWLSVGGGFSYQYLRLELASDVAQSLIFGPTVSDSEFVLNAANWALGYNLGFVAEPMDGTRLGLTYRSGVSHHLHGSLRFSANTSPLLGLTTQPAKSDIDLPGSVTASITQQISPNLSLSSDVQFTQWHVFKQVSVDSPPNPNFTFQENYRDSWMASVGGEYQLNDTWNLRAGAGFDESPVIDAFRDTGVPDGDRYMIGFGPGIKLSDTTSLDAAYTHYFGGLASMNTSVNAVDPISGVVLHGRYNNSLNYLSMTYRATL